MGIDVVDDITPRVQYTATNGQTAFDYPFPIFSDDGIKVDQNGTLLTLTTHYTVSGVQDDNGGTVTLVTGATTGDIITLYRQTPLERLTDLQQNGPFASANFNDEFDRIILMIQELDEGFDRVLQSPINAETPIFDADTFDPIDPWLSKYLFINADGELVPSDGSEAANVLTTNGDLLTVVAGELTRVPIGTAGQVLKVNGGLPVWMTGADAGGGVLSLPVRGAMFANGVEVLSVDVNDVPLHIPEDCTITKVRVLTRGGTGSCVVDIWKRAYGTYPPTSANSITGASKPTITNGVKYEDTTLTGWTTAVSAGDTLIIKLDSVSTFTVVGVFLELTPVGSVAADGYTDERVREIIAEEGTGGSVNIAVSGSTYTVNVTGPLLEDVDVHRLVGSPAGVVDVTFNLASETVLRSTHRLRAALDFTGFASGSTVRFVNEGDALGCGGEGGDGASIVWWANNDSAGSTDPTSGKDGGPAVKGPGAGVTFIVTNANGRIWGGGGGGPGGGVSSNQATGAIASGGGGGAGAGGGKGGKGSRARRATSAASATDGGDSVPGPSSTAGSGGAGNETGSAEGGDGGAGGDWGTAGSAGGSPTGFAHDIAAAAAGAAGKAIDLNGGTVTFISGSGSPNVKGAVS